LQAWVDRTLRDDRIDAVIVFSSAMAQYVPSTIRANVFVDFVDVDSAKWSQYATMKQWPLSWIYRREGTRLLEFERATARRATLSFFVTEAEAGLFRRLAPGSAGRVAMISNGVDAGFFRPDLAMPSPFAPGSRPIVFTGAMNYWPNIDAVRWFAWEIFPALREAVVGAQFVIVGMRPAPAVKALQNEAIIVTGDVADVRPYLRHAAVVVAPMRIARGVQNKVLEAMAMARPVVASEACVTGIDAMAGRDFLTAGDSAEFVAAVRSILASPQRGDLVGRAARRRVVERYDWEQQWERLDDCLSGHGLPVIAAA
jgi:sugar transferase (PEP-CTERM/EpsH1 system associated)